MVKRRVRGYLRKNGTKVGDYYREQPQSGERRGVDPDAAIAAAATFERTSTELAETHSIALTDPQAHASYPSDAARITKPLAESGIAVAHHRRNLVVRDDVLRMLDEAHDGFTYPPDGSRLTPQTGYAVTIQGTDYQFSTKEVAGWSTKIDLSDRTVIVSETQIEAERRDLDDWLVSVRPLLDTGYVWIGGWHNKSQGTFEVNVTLVIDEQYRDEAVMFGQDWDQYAIWDFGSCAEIETGGSGKATLYAADNPVWSQVSRLSP